MDEKERQIMREHIVWLGTELERHRTINQHHTEFLKRILEPEDLGHAVSHEVRQLAYVLLINQRTE